ncbi:E3 ubiquitin-protein ligase TRIM37-like isoform X2 [Armigeres subalbatus]|uniref:E3 ubiquitin-protein ligase TRIM37-like isoform X2 n=1 Tax=Armigeres subalbatus TaxID=124917 RepID=UPI002ED666E0
MHCELEVTRKTELLQHFQCGICLESVHEARLCPDCSKLFCHQCIRAWIDKGAKSCPNCRTEVSTDSWVKGYSINQIQESMRKLFASMEEGMFCKDHINQQLSLFCYLCEVNICVKCWFSEEHAEHKERTVPIEEAFEYYQQNLKASLRWATKREKVLNDILDEIAANQNKLNDERNRVAELCDKSKTLVADQSHPVKLMQIIQTGRAIVQLHTDLQDETKALRFDRRKYFVPKPTALVFRIENIPEVVLKYVKREVSLEDPYGCEWKCNVFRETCVGTILIVELCLVKGKTSEYSVLFGEEQEAIYHFGKEAVRIGTFDLKDNIDHDFLELTISVSQSYGDRLDQLQDYIRRLEIEKEEYKSLKKYLAEWETKITPSCV